MKTLVLMLVAAVCLHGVDFKKTRLLHQNAKGKMQEVKVKLHVDANCIQLEAGKVEIMRFEFSGVKSIEYERSTHPRWRTAVLVSPLFLLSKAKHHWLNIQGENGQYAILRLAKGEQQMIRAAVAAGWGQDIQVMTPE